VIWLICQEKDARLKKLRDAVDEEIEQETRKAKIDKESAIKLVMNIHCMCSPCGAGAPSIPPCPFTFSSFPLYFSLSVIGFTFFPSFVHPFPFYHSSLTPFPGRRS